MCVCVVEPCGFLSSSPPQLDSDGWRCFSLFSAHLEATYSRTNKRESFVRHLDPPRETFKEMESKHTLPLAVCQKVHQLQLCALTASSMAATLKCNCSFKKANSWASVSFSVTHLIHRAPTLFGWRSRWPRRYVSVHPQGAEQLQVPKAHGGCFGSDRINALCNTPWAAHNDNCYFGERYCYLSDLAELLYIKTKWNYISRFWTKSGFFLYKSMIQMLLPLKWPMYL